MKKMSPEFATHSKPTVVLVHGAFADGSCWSKVIADLEAVQVELQPPPEGE